MINATAPLSAHLSARDLAQGWIDRYESRARAKPEKTGGLPAQRLDLMRVKGKSAHYSVHLTDYRKPAKERHKEEPFFFDSLKEARAKFRELLNLIEGPSVHCPMRW